MPDKVKHSDPISIPTNSHSHSRSRSFSYSASSSSEDESNSPPPKTPTSSVPSPRVNTTQSSSTSPILSYFLTSPTKNKPAPPPSPSANFASLGRFAAKPNEPIIEEDNDHEPPIVRHARRMSTSAGWPPSAPRFNPGMAAVPTSEQHERSAGLLRRLSLGSALVWPQIPTQNAAPTPNAPPPPVPVREGSPPMKKQPGSASSAGRNKRRSATLGVPSDGARPRRSPSPMGERILKGHFDGFN